MSPRQRSTSRRVARLALGALALAACQGADQPRIQSAESPVVAVEAPAATGSVATAPQVRPAVDWSAADAHAQLDPALIPEPLRQILARIPVPALLPPDPELLARAIVTTGESWYGAHVPLDGATLYIQGTLVAHPAPPGVEATDPGSDPTVTRTHGIVAASFRAFGVAYTVHLECERPFEDPRCVEDGFVVSLVDGLAVAGGHR